jgi:PhnB protein
MKQHVFPMLSYEDVGRAADWLTKAFGFEERERYADEEGTVTHVTLALDDELVFLGFPSPDYRGPRRHAEECETARRWRETPYVVDGVMVYVDDVGAHFERAHREGAAILTEPEDNAAAGHRQYRVEDVEGHRWMFAQAT